MKPVPSVLKILDFAVTKMDFEIIPPAGGKNKNALPSFDDYELNLDFSVFVEEVLQIVMHVDINNADATEKTLPGYSLSATVTTLFKFRDTSSITPEQKKSIEDFSMVYMALNNLRGVISGFTANAPFGRYTLPSVDLNDLIKRKREESSQVAPEKIKAKTKIKTAKDE